jgi:hypothetical protein
MGRMTGPSSSPRASGPTVFLHIGTPKSGTTYLQSRLALNHRRAAAQGLLWPGPEWAAHVAGAQELRELSRGERPAAGGPWDRLVRDAHAWRGDSVLISMEWLAALSTHRAAAAVESLRPSRVEVICTARDLVRSFVAQGQEMTKNYRTWAWAELVDQVLNDKRGRAHRVFWRQQDLPRILERWLGVVPADRVHLVTVPPAGTDPEVLWRRFCSVVGIDGTEFEQPESDNASLGVVSMTLMQRLNVAAGRQDLDLGTYKRAVQTAVGFDVLAPRRKQEQPIAVTDEMDAFLRERSAKMLEEVKGLGVQLHGDWDDLVPGERLRGRLPEEVTERELLDLAAEALVTLAVTSSKEIDELRARDAAGVRGQLRRAAGRVRRAASNARHR